MIKLKKSFLMCLILGGSVFARAQDVMNAPVTNADTSGKTRTLLSGAKVKYIGFYVAPEAQYTSVAGNFTYGGGVSAGMVFNKRWSIGVFGTQTEAIATTFSDNTGLQLRTMQGGGFVEYTFSPNSVFHISLPVQFGGGMARLDSVNSSRSNYGRGGRDFGGINNANNQQIFFIQPNLRAELNVARMVKVFAGAGYRLSFGDNVSYPNASGTTSALANSQLGGFSSQVGIKVGLFDINMQRKLNLRFWKKHRHEG
ncbi:MAG: hypothetical protein RL757_2813 [Bacteroidota bacterium]|jgi:predicted secreted protein